MFLKKRPRIEDTPADRRRKNLLYDEMDAYNRVTERVERVIIRRGVVDIYPDGPDRDAAIADLEAAKKSLIAAIGAMDSVLNELRQYIKEHRSEFVTTANWQEPSEWYTSHRIVEDAYAEFYTSRR